jgi:hypothetical protein
MRGSLGLKAEERSLAAFSLKFCPVFSTVPRIGIGNHD